MMRELLRNWDVDSDEKDETIYGYARLMVLGWLYSHRGERFSNNSLAKELGVGEELCARALHEEEIACLVGESGGKAQALRSIAPRLDPTIPGLFEEFVVAMEQMDPLGVKEELNYRATDEFFLHRRKKSRQERSCSRG